MKLINANCLDYFKIMSNNSVDFTLTSPPYNRKRNDKYSLYNDVIDDYFAFNVEVIQSLQRITKNYIFYNLQTNYYNRQDVYKLIGYFCNNIKDIFVWEKTNPLPASGRAITNAIEYFLVFSENKIVAKNTYTKNIIKSSVNSNMPKFHKAVMKQEIADYIIDNFAYNSNLIFDPFMGLGTTGIAAVKQNKDFFGIELIKEYYDYAKENLDDN
jgi:site-specific DNA-methyltransferase (adenine-specific)